MTTNSDRRQRHWRRRSLTVPVTGLALPVLLLFLPATLVLASLHDLIRGRRGFPTVRLNGFLIIFLTVQQTAIVVATWHLLRRGTPRGRGGHDSMEAHYNLKHWWARHLLGWADRLLGIRFEFVDGAQQPPPGPIIVASRHSSMPDAVFPVLWLLGSDHITETRYVLKRELRFEPAIDIVGHRVNSHFVTRGGPDSDTELDAITALIEDLPDYAAAVIFPEGTYATEARRRRVLERLTTLDHEAAEHVRSLRHLLPARYRGIFRMIDAAPHANVVFLGHVGLDHLSSIPKLWGAIPFRESIQVRTWICRHEDIPADPDARAQWLRDQWSMLDTWIDEVHRTRSQPA
ncbi:MAG: hypothetical protein GY698_05285 [Actinomycetia bacterium]|nr:hypothetical protein [Actinomycetes bacterium]